MSYVKQYRCPECNKYGDAKSWDEETLKHYDESENITSIEDNKNECYFCCPNCKLDIDGKDIKTNEELIKPPNIIKEKIEEILMEYMDGTYNGFDGGNLIDNINVCSLRDDLIKLFQEINKEE